MNFGDSYSYVVQTSAENTAETVAAVQRVSRATKQAGDAAKQAARDQEKAARDAAREVARAAREQERAVRESARQQAAEARKLAREQIAAAKQAEQARRQSAREQIKAARDAANAEVAEARRAAAAQKQASRDIQGAAKSRAGALGGFAMQFSSIADDIQFGARGIQNNVSGGIAALGGYTPAAQLAAGATSLLIGLNKGWIDSMLAAAGVLDENLVAGLEKSTEATEDLTKSASVLDRVLNQQQQTVDRWAASLATVSDRISNTAVDEALRAIANEAAPLGAEIGALGDQLAEAEEKMRKLAEAPDPNDKLGNAAAAAARRVEDLNEQMQVLRVEAQKRVDERFTLLKDQLEAGGKAAEGVIDRMAQMRGESDRLVHALRDAALGTAKLKEEQKEFADAILEGEKALKERRDAIAAESDAFADAIRKEVDAVREGEKEKAKVRAEAGRQRANQLEREALDADTRRVVEAFGPLLQGQIGAGLQRGVAGGLSPADAAQAVTMQAAGVLGRAGVGEGAALQAAATLVNEQAPQVQAMVDSDNAQAAMMRQVLAGWDVLLQVQERRRAESIQGLQQAELLRRRTQQQQNRRMAPMRFGHGNAVNGRF